jgi:hypothetical protein
MSDNKLFEWYKMSVDLGRFEVEHSRIRFYENCKLQVAILAGVLALDSFAVLNKIYVIIFLADIICAMGMYISSKWGNQIIASASWESTWYSIASEFETNNKFKKIVGANKLGLFSHPLVKEHLSSDKRISGATAQYYTKAISAFSLTYFVIINASIFYLISLFF